MRKLYIKQKVFSLSGKFSVKDAEENEIYFVEGSFMKIPKTFSVMGDKQNEVATITKKTFSFLPTFFVDVHGQETMTIKKQFSFLKARYTIDAAGIEVQGNWWDMDFEVYQNRDFIGSVSKKWFTWGDSYELQIANDEMEPLLVALVVAIDCAKADQSAAVSVAAG
ncbi:LURP-one-related family protein [Sporosarcina sp. Marseille-Q4063]|uniref:LURP-one-related/scramblase family protein n=1 Tax=Sporosarcina sp. Marseille-Q4063 TaxID=2810514 RepID=UPI001BB04553|nr:LURP-one-related family protein [Sporosarcina sp. Marseille-Q4063]QUW22996.1 LURP-one-related family protein [Sporosarcina sp. Marseille-Q4063]